MHKIFDVSTSKCDDQRIKSRNIAGEIAHPPDASSPFATIFSFSLTSGIAKA